VGDYTGLYITGIQITGKEKAEMNINSESNNFQTRQNHQDEITRKGNPRKPQGPEGKEMLQRMSESHRDVTKWALDFFEYQENDWVLDIGCGGGAALARMSERIGSGHLTGVDYSEVSVNLSRERNAEDIKNGKMEIVKASVEKLPFPDESFDKIVTIESFYFWPDPVDNLREVLRTLKKGGTFLLVADIYQKEDLPQKARENVAEYQLFNPTKEEFQKLLEQAGFDQIIIHTLEGEDWICVEGSKIA